MKAELKDQVFRAADELFADGNLKPTNTDVRERIGSGSLSHISPLMSEWRKLRIDSSKEKVSIPEDIQMLADSTLHQLWSSAHKLANKTLEVVRGEHTKELDEKRAELGELLNEIERLECELESRASELALSQQKELAAASKSEALSVELSALNERLSNRETLLQDKDAQISSLTKNQSELIGRLDAMSQEVIKLSNRFEPHSKT